eukprot:scaffold3376_cov127-Isochrysis_galbana.AAC.6
MWGAGVGVGVGQLWQGELRDSRRDRGSARHPRLVSGRRTRRLALGRRDDVPAGLRVARLRVVGRHLEGWHVARLRVVGRHLEGWHVARLRVVGRHLEGWHVARLRVAPGARPVRPSARPSTYLQKRKVRATRVAWESSRAVAAHDKDAHWQFYVESGKNGRGVGVL